MMPGWQQGAKGETVALNQAYFDYLRTLLRQRSGIVLQDEKEYLVETRLSALAHSEGLASVESLLAKLQTQPPNGLHERVIEAMTTNETSFYRDVQPFEALRTMVLPELFQRRARERQLSIWCGAASSGQEPYSLCMLLREHFPVVSSWNVWFLATDLSRAVLDRARRGLYSQVEVNRGLEPRLLMKYFEHQGLEWQLKDDIRRMVEFRQLNLLESWPLMQPLDIVLLRNVLIYFDVETRKLILGRIRRLLRPGGFLFLGGAETTLNLDDAFECVPFDRAGCYRLRGTST
jgi:chemotaxis protein methyltransferase CheR